ncbi:LysM peptidoglycan-binding domain-containing protein [Paenarthrobacter aurescens]|nr:LysM peptidoglycan-binding domain-containing protein [Paenarthrobacter aurescens]MDO6143214.1 LysM peptidoglycan-binding domain-containing protein [Paenarthrobacter aurescens]MDO6147060.1 LysM peptidoglycan-binding domain-containing protein [Paenarthrobacter aurescens]MDO6158306.1 LysM peptidoglycan-binding domain-containing protein [Paenarthrobacter aurescens]MDO6162290.1 LysM peptidoglycan-binding domain-containing protein [Paenarthrobacter aurescens]
MTTPRSPKRTMSMPVIAATTAALPAVVLSSLALAQPSVATPAPQPRKIPATLAAAMKAQAVNVGTVIPANAVAATLPATLRPMAPSVPDTYTIVRGDTISAIARRFNLDTAAVLQLNKLSATTLIYPGQTIKLKGTASAPAQPAPAAPSAPSATTSATVYTVVPGDTLGAIAAKHGVPLSSIFSWNGLNGSSIIYPGQKIKVSGGSAPSAPSAPAAPAPAPAPLAGTGSYTIKAGDTLSSIASRHGVSLAALMAANNNVTATTVIYPGQKLTIPGAGLQPVGDTKPLVPSTFLGFTYPPAVVSSANENKALLNASPVPSRAEMKSIVADTARRMGVSPSLALAFAEQESGFDQRAVSPANAIGTMQVIPSSGQWASDLVGRKLNLLDPYDNATAGVAIIRTLIATSKDLDTAIAGYYQGQYSVSKYGMYEDTKRYVESIKARQRTFG